ncbi:HNH endonuclease [Agrococcus carbonis]|uniref:5-methylcytosine-specific restriction endonuclease McrA n=1 Tax=Agrococcus carbonis TaxID=684552 RepID=A0A1H1LAP2_9MICO|nr:HNH endonuclease [Agrococcus carbonis]SDR71661.1 5-methylcytosine-specific restriction endonuclease McrA [Agrococcus carbonis]
MTAQVVVLNATLEPIGVASLQRAVAFIVKERAQVMLAGDGTIRSNSLELPVPRVVVFNDYVQIPHTRLYDRMPWTRRGVLDRDRRRCAYCGGPGATIDHIQPVSRGGESSWLNTITACVACNGAKGNRTPAEAGMPLRFEPRVVWRREVMMLAVEAAGVDLQALGLAR